MHPENSQTNLHEHAEQDITFHGSDISLQLPYLA